MQMWHGKGGSSFRKIDGYRSLDGLSLNMSQVSVESAQMGISNDVHSEGECLSFPHCEGSFIHQIFLI